MKYTTEQLIDHVNKSYELANSRKSKLTQEILEIEGMSGSRTRHLYNNLCSLNEIKYLEIGVWKGSTFISSLYNNNVKATAIDNFSEFDGTYHDFKSNTDKYLKGYQYHFIDKDCFKLSREDFNFVDFDIYMYDGRHWFEDQSDAITYYTPYMNNKFVLIVDDWDREEVRNGTYDGIDKSKLKTNYKLEVYNVMDQEITKDYWGGFGIFVLEK